MTLHNRLRGEFKEQCFCTDVSLKYATLACKYSKDEVADWWLSKFDQELESIIGEIEKEKVPPKDFQRFTNDPLHPVSAYQSGSNRALDTAIAIIRDKITK
jgi:hypothetical protein